MPSVSPTRYPAYALMHRQMQAVLRRRRGLWTLGAALLMIAVGFTAAYRGAVGQAESNDALGTLGKNLLDSYRLYSLFSISVLVPLVGFRLFSEERESNTLESLLSTPLSLVGVIFAKSAVSFGMVQIAIFSTLPFLALTFPMGSVSPGDVAALAFRQSATAILVLLGGLWAGLRAWSVFRGLASAYALSLALVAFNSALTYMCLVLRFAIHRPAGSEILLRPVDEILGTALTLAVVALLFGRILVLAVPSEFAQLDRSTPGPKPAATPPPQRFAGLFKLLGWRAAPEPISDFENPVYRSERSRFLIRNRKGPMDPLTYVFIIFVAFALLSTKPEWMLWIGTLLGMVVAPILAGPLLAGERERGTWPSLSATLLGPGKILGGKLRHALEPALLFVGSLYLLPLLPMGMLWIAVSGTSPFTTENFLPVWGGHLLNLPIVLCSVLFFSAMAIWTSSLFRKTFLAVATAYSLSLLFLFLPRLLRIAHPDPWVGIGGRGDFDWLSALLAPCHAPFLYRAWSQVSPVTVLFIHAGHILLLLTLSTALYHAARRRIGKPGMYF